MSIYFLIYIQLLLLKLIRTQLAIASIPFQDTLLHLTYIYQDIFSKILPTELWKINNFSIQEPAIFPPYNTTGWDDYNSVIEISISEYLHFNLNFDLKLEGNLNTHLLVLSPYPMSLFFRLHSSINSTESIEVGLNVSLPSIVIEEKSLNNELNCSVTLKKKKTKFEITFDTQETEDIRNLVIKAIECNFVEKYCSLLEVWYEKAIFSGYKSYFLTQPPISLTTSDYFGGLKFKWDLGHFINFTTDVIGSKNKALWYFSGNISETIDYDSAGDCLSNYNFVNGTNPNNTSIFINSKIIKQIIEKVDELKINLTWNNSNRPANTIDLHVDYLSGIIPNVVYHYHANTEFSLNTRINKIYMLTSSSGWADVSGEIVIEGKIFTEIKVQIEFYLHVITKFSAMNLCVSLFHVLNFQVINSEERVINTWYFKSIYEDWLNYINYVNSICLLNSSINWFRYIKYIEKSFISIKGIFLEGARSKLLS